MAPDENVNVCQLEWHLLILFFSKEDKVKVFCNHRKRRNVLIFCFEYKFHVSVDISEFRNKVWPIIARPVYKQSANNFLSQGQH